MTSSQSSAGALEPDDSQPICNEPAADSRCFVDVTINVIGGKWKPMIVWCLIQGAKRFSELARLIPQVTHQMLSTHLRQLERDGIVTRTVYAEVPPRVEYAPTELGRTLEPLLAQMHVWGETWFEQKQSSV